MKHKLSTKIKQAMRKVDRTASKLEQEAAELESLLIGTKVYSCIYPVKDFRAFAEAMRGSALTIQDPIFEYLEALHINDKGRRT